jgi:uncharacterized Tic20 family protein
MKQIEQAQAIETYEKNNSMLIHFSGLSNLLIPLGNIIVPILLWQILKKKSEFIDYHGKEAVNFNLSYVLYSIILVLITGSSIIGTIISGTKSDNIVGVILGSSGFFLSLAILSSLFIIKLIFIIIASFRANDGEWYRYPFIIRFIK